MPHWQFSGIFGVWRHDLGDRVARLPAHRHEDARHHREVERHVALVAPGGRVAEVLDHVGGPLVGLGEQHPVGVEPVDLRADPLEVVVRLGQVLAVGALPLEEVGDGVQPETVDAEVQPEAQHLHHRVLHGRVVVVEVRLVGEEAVPVVLAADRVVGPVGRLGVDEDDPGVLVAARRCRSTRRSRRTARRGRAGRLEPRVLVAGVVHHQVGDDADAALVRLVDQLDEVAEIAELGQDLHEVAMSYPPSRSGDCVERQQPEAVDAEPLEIVELVDEAVDVAGAVAVGVGEAADREPRRRRRACTSRDRVGWSCVEGVRDRRRCVTALLADERSASTLAARGRVKTCAGWMCGSSRT